MAGDAAVQRRVDGEGPGAKADAGVERLRRLSEDVIKEIGGALVGDQRQTAAAEKHIARRDAGADRDMKGVPQQTQWPVADLDRPHERHRVEVAEQLEGADAGIDGRRAGERRADRGVDARKPQIGRGDNLQAADRRARRRRRPACYQRRRLAGRRRLLGAGRADDGADHSERQRRACQCRKPGSLDMPHGPPPDSRRKIAAS